MDSSRVTLREYPWGTPKVLLPLMAVLELLRVRLPSSADEANVDRLEPFRVITRSPYTSQLNLRPVVLSG